MSEGSLGAPCSVVLQEFPCPWDHKGPVFALKLFPQSGMFILLMDLMILCELSYGYVAKFFLTW